MSMGREDEISMSILETKTSSALHHNLSPPASHRNLRFFPKASNFPQYHNQNPFNLPRKPLNSIPLPINANPKFHEQISPF
jgi:hypothetical protein